ncbi:DUF4199 domain-containing protein [Aquimarina algiphila]|uniref:DUF4199 domain-containing protein n=1 Tax=Aquimarina algiphila TaxID=2047982 RepID=UPI00232EE9E1|nr:DUF4199 domain-containing protein [Aquimarina algiphila]
MENDKASTKKIIIKYGIIYGITWITYSIIRYITGYTTTRNWFLSVIELSIHIGVISYSIYTFKLANNHFLKLGQALKVGFSIVLIGVGIQVLWDIFLLKVISSETMYQMISSLEKSTITKPIEQNSTISRENSFLFTISLVAFIGNSILGFLISLIAGVIMIKKRDIL